MSGLRVVGIDASLTSTGVAVWTEDGHYRTRTICPKTTGHQRLGDICDELDKDLLLGGTVLAVIEGPAYATKSQRGAHERAGLWWKITHRLWRRGTPYAVITPTQLKQLLTGSGVADKGAILAAVIRRFPHFTGSSHDQADALGLACAAALHLGWPTPELPKAQAAVAGKIDWPHTP